MCARACVYDTVASNGNNPNPRFDLFEKENIMYERWFVIPGSCFSKNSRYIAACVSPIRKFVSLYVGVLCLFVWSYRLTHNSWKVEIPIIRSHESRRGFKRNLMPAPLNEERITKFLSLSTCTFYKCFVCTFFELPDLQVVVRSYMGSL